MKRRFFLGTSACMTAVIAAGCSPLSTINGQQVLRIPGSKLREALARRFPRSYPAGSALNIAMELPRLRFMQEQNRIGLEMPFEAISPALPRHVAGVFDVDFGLRYEPGDLSIRTSRLKVNALEIDGLPFAMKLVLSTYATPLAERALDDVVLHQFTQKDLTLTDGMGLQPSSIDVTAEGLLIGFVKKPITQLADQPATNNKTKAAT